MGIMINTIASLMLVSSGTYGLDALFERFATPEARGQIRTQLIEPADPDAEGEREASP